MKFRIIILAALLLTGLCSSVLAQEQSSGESWFMKTGKTSRGGHKLPVRPSGLPTPTAALIKMKVETYPELAVSVQRSSPFDLALKRADLRADMLLDLAVVELTNFPVSTRLR